MLTLVFVLTLFVTVLAKKGFGPNDQDWGYVTVRDKAHMFWWLHYTTAVEDYKQRPLVIWLQGGPGGSSTGVGNFHEIGPWDVDQKDRELSWVKFLNVLFVDNPVGTGFSYVEDSNDNSLFAPNNTIIAKDFLALLKGFLNENPGYEQVPLYIFGQSYGGKMAADIALLLDHEIKTGSINCNLKGVGLGDPWISPIDSVISWPSYLLNLGFIDTESFEILQIATEFTKAEIDAGRFEQATGYFKAIQTIINQLTTVDFYNILDKKQVTNNSTISIKQEYSEHLKKLLEKLNIDFSKINWKDVQIEDHEDIDAKLQELMNGPVATSLNIKDKPTSWGDQSESVFRAVNLDFMKPVTKVIETILNTTDLKVTIYNGQLDLIVDTPGTISWVNKLQWTEAMYWKAANRTPIIVDSINEGYSKSYGNFNFYWINRAGHAVPTDNPKAMEYVLREVTNNYTVTTI